MKQQSKLKCRHCRDLYRPDRRNLRHQHYCSKPACRQASKAASQRRWLGKAENQDYFRGSANIQRVQAWRSAHPGYWKRSGPQTEIVLQEDSLAQLFESTEKTLALTKIALQDLLFAQPPVLIGLIASLTDTALQEDIAQTGRRLQQLGQDILSGGQCAEGGCDAKTSIGPFAGAPDPPQFSWVDQRLVRDHHIERCNTTALALYLFLLTVADARGLSYYADASIERLLCLRPEPLAAARGALIYTGLIAYEAPLYQVLALDTPPATTPLSRSPPVHSGSPDAARGLRSLQEILHQTLGDPS